MKGLRMMRSLQSSGVRKLVIKEKEITDPKKYLITSKFLMKHSLKNKTFHKLMLKNKNSLIL